MDLPIRSDQSACDPTNDLGLTEPPEFSVASDVIPGHVQWNNIVPASCSIFGILKMAGVGLECISLCIHH